MPTFSTFARPSGLFLVSGLALLTAGGGCGDSAAGSSPNPDLGVDLAQRPPDLATAVDLLAPSDLAPSCAPFAVLGPQQPSVSADCTMCVKSRCCGQLASCGADSACTDLRACLGRCKSLDDDACVAACAQASPAGEAGHQAVETCSANQCAAECANWSCVGSVTWSAPMSQTATLHLVISDSQNNGPVPATVKVCRRDDAACAAPLSTTTADLTGAATVTAPAIAGGIDAYLEIAADKYRTHLAYPALVPDRPGLDGQTLAIPLVSQDAWNLLTTIAHINVDDTHGHILFRTLQCVNQPGPGVSVSSDATDGETKRVYLIGYTGEATLMATVGSGTGVISNVPAGAATVTAKLASNGAQVASVPVAIRAGALTAVWLAPSP